MICHTLEVNHAYIEKDVALFNADLVFLYFSFRFLACLRVRPQW